MNNILIGLGLIVLGIFLLLVGVWAGKFYAKKMGGYEGKRKKRR